MARIVYLAYPNGQVSGGQKMIVRHVETLCDLGFDAIRWVPPWATDGPYEHTAPTEVGTDFRSDDILVIPSDAPRALKAGAARERVVVFEQNQFTAVAGYSALETYARPPAFICVGPTCARVTGRAWPGAQIELVPAYVDEQVFRPGSARELRIVYAPRKRKAALGIVQAYFRRMHPRHAAVPWQALENLSERQMAEVFANSAAFLSLCQYEAAPLTPLEAMAGGALVAGFTGIGGNDYATPDNGFWAGEDDCEAAADALAAAVDLVLSGGPTLESRRQAGYATAREWSYLHFRDALADSWVRLSKR